MSPTRPSAELERLRTDAAGCTRCDLYERATQTVFGEGPVPASLMLMGEVPGDREDVEGHPFVGPTGRAVFGSSFRVTRQRGAFVTLPSGVEATATLHPSAVLRAENRDEVYAGLVDDLRAVAQRVAGT